MIKKLDHKPTYKGAENGAGQIVCSCGWETPSVHSGDAFTLGRKVKQVEEYFREHIDQVTSPETAMVQPAAEHAVAPAQHSQPRIPKRKIEHR